MPHVADGSDEARDGRGHPQARVVPEGSSALSLSGSRRRRRSRRSRSSRHGLRG